MSKQLILCAALIYGADAFATTATSLAQRTSGQHATRAVTFLVAGGGFGATNSKNRGGGKKMKGSEKKKVQEKLLEKYGGDIQKGTEERINRAMSELPPHIQLATKIYKEVQQWEARLANMSLLAQGSIPGQQVQAAKVAKEELEELYKEHDLDDNDMHNIFQKITWDASADAKSARAAMFNMNKDLERRVDKACSYVVEAVKAAGASGRILDVGCGPGVLVPHLTKAGVLPKQITGTDLSPEMIRNAQSQHRGVDFIAADFLKEFNDDAGFDGIIFCSALHDMPEPVEALKKAKSLLRPSGKLVILHAQGASHVLGQVKANPVMVKRGLPSAQELEALNLGLQLSVAPVETGSTKESEEGYLAVLSSA